MASGTTKLYLIFEVLYISASGDQTQHMVAKILHVHNDGKLWLYLQQLHQYSSQTQEKNSVEATKKDIKVFNL